MSRQRDLTHAYLKVTKQGDENGYQETQTRDKN